MHEAYEASPLITLSNQIESIAAYGDNLLIGTRQGFLYMYNVGKTAEDKYDIQLMRYNKTFSKKPITQLDVMPDHQLLVSLTDNVVQLHDINNINFTTVFQLTKSRGATYFTLNIKREVSLTGENAVLVRMAVVVKRKLQLYFYKNSEFKELTEITLSEVPRSLIWLQESICVGYKGEYTLLTLDGQKIELFPTSGSRSAEPCMARASDTAFALCRDTQTVLVNDKGETEVSTALKWSDIPVALVWDEPYALTSVSDKVEIQTPSASGTIQTLDELSKVRFLIPSRRGLVYAASLSQVWAINAVDIGKQRKHLLEAKQFQLALKLTAISNESEEDKSEKVHQIQTLLAYDLFANKHFHESMKEFSKLKTDPYDVIRLFPELLPQQNNENQFQNTQTLMGKDLETGLLALIDYLTEVRHNLLPEVTGNNDSKGKSAYQLLQIIDTTLLKCYLQTNEALVAPLLRLNHCHLGEAEKVLKKMGRHNELVILYQTKGLHRKALELLKSENSVERTVKYLQHLGPEQVSLTLEFADWVLTASPEDGLRIFTEDLPEVESPPRPRILDFLLRSHPNMVIPYLEHIVHVWNDTNPLFHNALLHQYKEKALSNDSDSQRCRRSLLEFLEKSQHYTPDSVLAKFPTDNLLEEKALILGRLGRHDETLAIYVRSIGDVDKALKYCNRLYEQKVPGSKNVYVSLLKLVLNPDLGTTNDVNSPKTAQPNLELALSILQDHASRVDPVEVLKCLPDSIHVTRVRTFLLMALQDVLRERRKAQLLRGLLYAEHLQCQELRLRLQAQKVLVTELNVCHVCKKRFGHQSALIMYANGDIVHYSCQEKNKL